ncbi:MAG: metallophosphoesterase [Propionibacteriaceae bacterium]|nr:metallophosphoesterase [Propionibacteriaceae bacterium]
MHPVTIVGITLGVFILVVVGCLGYAMVVASRGFRLRRVEVPVLAEGSEPITILHFSDLHLLPSQAKKIEWVRGLAAHTPDFIISTGDNLSSPDGIPTLERALEPLGGIPGVFVFGSNDFFGPRPINPFSYLKGPSSPHKIDSQKRLPRIPTEDIAQLFESLGWKNGEDTSLNFTLRGTTVEVRGCKDAHMEEDRYEAVMGERDADLLLGVTHSPYVRVLDLMVADGADLMFAGHTHGGQVCFPGGHALVTNCDLPRSQAQGLSQYSRGDSSPWLHVSAGLGTSPKAPYRFFCRPEATLLTLVPCDNPTS